MTINDTGLPIHAIQQLQLSTYVHVASAALLILDWFLLLGDEIQYTWSVPWNLGTYLFFLTRYGAFVDTGLFLYQFLSPSPSSLTCFHFFQAVGAILIFGMIIAETTMSLRVWAMWDKNNKVGGLLLASLSFCSIAATALFAVSLKGYQGINNSSELVTGCFQTHMSKLLAWCFGALMFHQTFIFFMTLAKCIHHLSVGTSSFIRIFYLQGVVYYVILQVLSVANFTIVMLGLGAQIMTLVLSVQRVLQSVLCVRMLLHVRKVGQARTIATWTPVPSATSLYDLQS